jgi:hypothetical protein
MNRMAGFPDPAQYVHGEIGFLPGLITRTFAENLLEKD